MLFLDRVLYTSTHYPVPKTYAEDNDPLDVLVLCQEVIDPLTLVECYPIGVVKMIDSDEVDEKIIAIAKKDPSLNCYHDISELPKHTLNEISHFFEVYINLEGKKTVVKEVLGRKKAIEIIKSCLETYQRRFEK